MAEQNGSEGIGLREYLASNFSNVRDDIAGVHERLDKLNGKVGEHSSSIKVLQDHDKEISWFKRAVAGLLLTIVGGIIIAFVNYLRGRL